jgi:hypothetical protein
MRGEFVERMHDFGIDKVGIKDTAVRWMISD